MIRVMVTTLVVVVLATSATAETNECIYEGKKYSEGAIVKQGDGSMRTCWNGKWVE